MKPFLPILLIAIGLLFIKNNDWVEFSAARISVDRIDSKVYQNFKELFKIQKNVAEIRPYEEGEIGIKKSEFCLDAFDHDSLQTHRFIIESDNRTLSLGYTDKNNEIFIQKNKANIEVDTLSFVEKRVFFSIGSKVRLASEIDETSGPKEEFYHKLSGSMKLSGYYSEEFLHRKIEELYVHELVDTLSNFNEMWTFSQQNNNEYFSEI